MAVDVSRQPCVCVLVLVLVLDDSLLPPSPALRHVLPFRCLREVRPLDTERDDDDDELSLVLHPPVEWGSRPLVPRRAMRDSARDALRALYDDLAGDVLDLDDDDE
jgi:hypothetical protein